MNKFISILILIVLMTVWFYKASAQVTDIKVEQEKQDQEFLQCINNIQAHLLIEEWYSKETVAELYKDSWLTMDIQTCTWDLNQDEINKVLELTN